MTSNHVWNEVLTIKTEAGSHKIENSDANGGRQQQKPKTVLEMIVIDGTKPAQLKTQNIKLYFRRFEEHFSSSSIYNDKEPRSSSIYNDKELIQ